jgi:phosphohistidine phosphatase
MKRLILFRHGKAEGQAESGEDFDRALADRGLAEAAAMGRLLAKAGLVPDLALVSPAVRTRQTWEMAAPSFPDVRLQFAPSLYESNVHNIRALAQAATADAVMVVGHNPGLQELAVRLMQEAGAEDAAMRGRMRFPPASVAAFDFDAAGKPTHLGLFYPEGLR